MNTNDSLRIIIHLILIKISGKQLFCKETKPAGKGKAQHTDQQQIVLHFLQRQPHMIQQIKFQQTQDPTASICYLPASFLSLQGLLYDLHRFFVLMFVSPFPLQQFTYFYIQHLSNWKQHGNTWQSQSTFPLTNRFIRRRIVEFCDITENEPKSNLGSFLYSLFFFKL